MGEKKSKKRKITPASDVTEDPPAKATVEDAAFVVEKSLTGVVPISDNLMKKQNDAQKEKQKKIAEANKAIKREKRKNRAKKNKPLETVEQRHTSIKKTSAEYAISYVQQWKEDKSNWKFQTLVQSWILQNLLDDSKVRTY